MIKKEIKKKEIKKTSETKAVEMQKEKITGKPMFYQAVGRRREATARVRLYVVAGDEISVKGKNLKAGDMVVNGRMINDYFPGIVHKTFYTLPFKLTNTVGRFTVSAIVAGGGLSGQRDALVHGIARSLLKIDKDTNRSILRKAGLLTRDPRTRERRKAGLAQGARAKKQSPKR